MKNILNNEGQKLFSKYSNVIILVVLVLVACIVFGSDLESIIINFLKYFTKYY